MFLAPGRHQLLSEIAIVALFVLSLDLILGYAGIVSLGQAAFFGVGAYSAGLVAIHLTNDAIIGLIISAVVAGLVGFMTSFLVLRGSDLTRLMVTIGVTSLLGEVANKAASITGGADGLQGILMGPLLGMIPFDLYGTTAYGYSLAALFLGVVLAKRIVTSSFGLSLRAIRDNPLRASAVGIPVNARLVAIYTISSVYAGVAGALMAQTTQFVSLDVFDFHRSADALLMLVIGGTGYLYGGIAGAVVFKLIQSVLSDATPQYWHFWLGLLLVVLVLVGRNRVIQGIANLLRLRGRESSPRTNDGRVSTSRS
ncbi:branched-chain amino acid ABC transporter permease [Bradyrhizobium sp. CB2312]|uniref:branched-chain amino acid ABC transporter permease n=1 Tax=Bradyrhizobium sp. CB2312 TaxID=3039155 RepID=UPI0024B0ED6E|nr:branched-chain amino acid ABC transporter permease [Bradyrhizobium sp. CB2312]WFU76972.1 branched-chain amino acid ABC transporter permease [Bradyrhizobium sp. CB2312]